MIRGAIKSAITHIVYHKKAKKASAFWGKGEKMRKYGKWILTAATVLWCAVIWQFSLAPDATSSATSGVVREFLNDALSSAGLSFQFTPLMVRKIAHFSEFFVLGALLFFTLRAHGIPYYLPLSVTLGALVAAVDECIQIFVPGRGPAVSDVLLDTAGALSGALTLWGILALVLYIKEKISKKRKKLSKTS
jgi:VanZ family protein